jgi:hypothetical protein
MADFVGVRDAWQRCDRDTATASHHMGHSPATPTRTGSGARTR